MPTEFQHSMILRHYLVLFEQINNLGVFAEVLLCWDVQIAYTFLLVYLNLIEDWYTLQIAIFRNLVSLFVAIDI
jgi:hypothetical protein